MLKSEASRLIATEPGTSIYLEDWTSPQASPDSDGVLLVHGGPGLFGYMGELAEELGRSRPTWTYFQRGGRWSRTSSPITVNAHIEDLKHVLEEIKTKPIVVGHSWGGLLAMLTLAKYPDLASKVLLIGPMPFDLEGVGLFMKNIDDRLDDEERLIRTQRMGELMQTTEPAAKNLAFSLMSDAIFKTYQFHPTLETLSPKLDGVDADAFFSTQGDLGTQLAASTFMEKFRGFPLPVEIIFGEYDPSPCQRLADQLKVLIPDLQVHAIAECGHYPWWEAMGTRSQFHTLLEHSLKQKVKRTTAINKSGALMGDS